MAKIIKTKIDGVPVELEIIKIGPSSPDSIDALQENIERESIESINSTDVTFKVQTKKSNGKDIYSKDPQKLIENLINSIQNAPEEKSWWESKTIWVNILAIVTAIGTYIGMPIDIDPEMAMTIFPLILGIVNLVLRKGTNKKIKPLIHH